MVMESTHFRERDDRSQRKRMYRADVRIIHGQRQVRTPAMVIVKIDDQEAPQVGLAEDHHVIQTLPRMLPISRSAYGFCHGLQGVVRI